MLNNIAKKQGAKSWARSFLVAFIVAVFASLTAPSTAVGGPILSLPSLGLDATHFDLNAANGAVTIDPFPNVPAVPTPVVGGPCGAGPASVGCEFADTLNGGSLLFWETEINNPNTFPMVFNAGFFLGPDALVLGQLGLGAGESFYLNVAIDDSLFETASWTWFAANGLNNALSLVDTAVSEHSSVVDGVSHGDFIFQFSGNGFFTPDQINPDNPNFLINAVQVPEPSTLLLLGAGIVALGRRRILNGAPKIEQ